MANIQINQLLETTTAQNNDYIAIDNGSATKKIKVSNFNATGAASAAQSAAAAAQSATDAENSKIAAEQAEDDTQALITSAQTIVSDAQTYANDASTSAGTASTAANTATAQAAIATNQANLAAGYAQNVDTFAKTAKSWAVGGTGTRQGEDTDNSKYYADSAHTSEINAAASEQAAATSEANAAASETNAAASESNAATSEANAAQSESNASTSETNAALSASNALTSANNAATSESNAATSETNADLSSEDSEAWSVGQRNGVDVPPSDPTYHNNAKYWAGVAAGGVSGVSSFNGRSGNVVPARGDYAANIVEFDNTSNNFQSTNTQDAIEEVQDNVDDVASDLSTLDASLKPVAKSGAYSDLTGTPTLATVATSGSYSDLSNKPTLGTAAAKNSTNAVSPGSTDLVESGAVYDIADGLNNAILGNATAIAKAYKYDDTTDTTIADADYIPFYDTSAGTMKKITKANADFGGGGALYFTSVACAATTGNFATKSDSNITANHVVVSVEYANPSAITSDVTWTTANGSVTLNGTCASATTCSIVLVEKDN
jgi:hypothetical protein